MFMLRPALLFVTPRTPRSPPAAPTPRGARRCRCQPPPLVEFFAGSGLVSYACAACSRQSGLTIVAPRRRRSTSPTTARADFISAPFKVRGAKPPAAASVVGKLLRQDLSFGWGARRAFTQSARAGGGGDRRDAAAAPPLFVAENVVGPCAAAAAATTRRCIRRWSSFGYQAGGYFDAARFVLQSRPRVFVIAVGFSARCRRRMTRATPSWLHPPAVVGRPAPAGLCPLSHRRAAQAMTLAQLSIAPPLRPTGTGGSAIWTPFTPVTGERLRTFASS